MSVKLCIHTFYDWNNNCKSASKILFVLTLALSPSLNVCAFPDNSSQVQTFPRSFLHNYIGHTIRRFHMTALVILLYLYPMHLCFWLPIILLAIHFRASWHLIVLTYVKIRYQRTESQDSKWQLIKNPLVLLTNGTTTK